MARLHRRGAASGPVPSSANVAPALRALFPVVAVDFTVFGTVFPILPLEASRLGLSVTVIGVLMAAYSFVQLICAPAWGRLADRLGRRPVLLVALAGTFVSALLIGLSTDAELLFVAVVLNGASGGSMAVAQAAVADLSSEQDQPRNMGRLGACIAAGFVVGPALAAGSSLGTARLPFLLAAALAAINLVVALVRMPETLPTARELIGVRRPADPDFPPVHLAAGELRRLMTSFGLSACAFGGIEATFALLGRRHLGFGEAGTGLSFALVGVVMFAVQGGLVGPVHGALGRLNAIRLGAVAFAGGLVVVGETHTAFVLCLGLVCLGVGYGLTSPLLTAAIASGARTTRRGATLGRLQAMGSLARVVGPLLAAGVFAGAGAFGAYLVLAAMALAVVAIVPAAGVGPRGLRDVRLGEEQQ